METPFRNQSLKIKRTVRLTQILAKYGFQDLRGKYSSSAASDELSSETSELASPYKRIRLAIEELGPTFVKFGQTLSSREDLLPKELIVELKKLQDRVPTQELDIRTYLEDELGIDVNDHFTEVRDTPIASASIAQVYEASLRNGDQVILKVKRPHIKETIDSDLLILKDIVHFLSNYFDSIRKINLEYILHAFKKTLMEEVSFINETKNIQQFAQNFRGSEHIKCMKVYEDYSNDNLLCISRISGVKINDVEKIKSFGLSVNTIVDRGLDAFLTQILYHGFFHADPHPGNILVNSQGQITFLDLGAVGTMLPSDKLLLEDFVSSFIAKDVDNIIYIIKKMAVHIEIENEKNLKREISALLEMANANSLASIDTKVFFSKFSNILNENNIIMPDHIYLLVRGIVLMEGIGRELLPDMNIVEKLKPYVDDMIKKRLSMEHIQSQLMRKLQESYHLLDQAPHNLRVIAQKLEQGDLSIVVQSQELKNIQKQYKKNQSTSRLLAIGCVFFYWRMPTIGRSSFFDLRIANNLVVSFFCRARFYGIR
ncbi:ABC1 kinase family protein [Sphingobacterium populi]|uniref:ABC1 kinase family protein n=1 Tax=Sphingobacterium sp. CFCC 11742 TaxID=1775560 RepID=UPI000834CF70|nr:AarF/UbiB family protein [Sphingobacterium sp. CFCC 11742]